MNFPLGKIEFWTHWDSLHTTENFAFGEALLTRLYQKVKVYKFQNDQCPDYFHKLFCPVVENGVIKPSFNKILKFPFWETKLGIQSLSYVGPKTLSSLPNNLKSAISVSSFKHYIKDYFLKNIRNFEADIYNYT